MARQISESRFTLFLHVTDLGEMFGLRYFIPRYLCRI